MYKLNNNIQSLNYVLTFFPFLKEHLKKKKTKEEALSEVELTFLSMCKFFQNPNDNSFDFRLVYKHLNEEWIIVALKALDIFVKKDSLLINPPSKLTTGNEKISYNIKGF